MPRLPRSLVAKAWRQDPLLPLLLRPCRDLGSARCELRWLKEHAAKVIKTASNKTHKSVLHQLCKQRARGKPLQYLIGSEYFGPIEIACRPGVLIPRPETAASVTYLIEQFCHKKSADLTENLKVLDLCSGTGCISLLFAHLFPFDQTKVSDLQVVGVDISKTALSLANLNRQKLMDLEPTTTSTSARRAEVEFILGDLRSDDSSRTGYSDLMEFLRLEGPVWDIIISNPPYISPKAFNTDTTRSVRNFEPRLALVPQISQQGLSDEEHGDVFYPQLLEIAEHVSSKILLMEVADMAQAERIAKVAKSWSKWDGVEIWCDEPAFDGHQKCSEVVEGVQVRGRGDGRSVFCWRGDAKIWLGK
ncbi:S-adenosyl-L-methionine-dependent methyltransferase [Tothia fuscella]|uniref:S-adenosyl-L-methionine-dependent methyltransferase n=1 Tax=Tothia fuscella TaxID=1048955 RepID=A0A9P4NLS0_9PEZI|nr:S-adenosyl-L-methionine-dependent methyltransferase [Tothia fuscella]